MGFRKDLVMLRVLIFDFIVISLIFMASKALAQVWGHYSLLDIAFAYWVGAVVLWFHLGKPKL